MSDSFVTPWTVICQAPLSMGFPRQEYWSGLLFPSPGDHPDPGIRPASSDLAGTLFTIGPPGKPTMDYYSAIKRNEIMPFVVTWLNLEMTILSEMSVRERQI